MKQCQRCGKTKETTKFSKCSKNKDGLQYKCKQCDKETNLKFRTEINPTHHEKWQNKNWDKFVDYVKKYRKADKTPIIYSIKNPDGFQYIGMSMMSFKVRLWEHRAHYRRALIWVWFFLFILTSFRLFNYLLICIQTCITSIPRFHCME